MGLRKVVEGNGFLADDLTLLMALAGDHQNIPRFQPVHRFGDGLGAVADVRRRPCFIKDLTADICGPLGAGVGVRNNEYVCVFLGDGAHFRTLAGIPVAAAAEHQMQLSLGMRAHRLQHIFKGVGGMGKIDINRCAGRMAPG